MTLRLHNMTLDCADTAVVSAFWSAALDRPIDDGASEFFVSIGGSDDDQTGWFFIKVPEGKTVKNRVHIDLRADDREREVDRLIGLGAKRFADYDEYDTRWTTLHDPEGNEFCVS
jgi:predicted enzyme related to lactoylglutathione lyase